jgi:hypothetical protein
MSEFELPKPMPAAKEDARALLARLYREIGVSAVAAALQVSHLPETEQRRTAAERQAQTIADRDTLAA